MPDTVIHVDNLSKKYILGTGRSSDGLRHAIHNTVTAPLRWLAGRSAPSQSDANKIGSASNNHKLEKEFWALRNVSFEIKQGEVVGIIGRNGAGKSTLLKILSRITEPTEGEVQITGRVASLLEVGTGFHPELTGRENVFLNGAILGMSRAEIKRKFDEIVAFAEVERFLDTPVKRYSSGMYVRLAFAVAAHLEPEILIVDEVLAVGDAEFQKKCLGKMQDVSSKEGRTVLFVSHNMGAIGKLCGRSVLLEAGRISRVGTTEEVLAHYLSAQDQCDGFRTWKGSGARGFSICALRILTEDGQTTGRVDIRHSFAIEVSYTLARTIPRFRIALRFVTSDGTIAFTTSDSSDPSYDTKPCSVGSYTTRCMVPGNLLNEGAYSLTLSADIPFQEGLFVEERAMSFYVEQTGGINSRFTEKWPGVVCPQLKWGTESVERNEVKLIQRA